MKALFKFSVRLSLPDPLQPLLDIAQNLWWTWSPEAIDLFERTHPDLWEDTRHNPILMMGYMSLEEFGKLMANPDYMTRLASVHENLKSYLAHPGWFETAHKGSKGFCVGYFAAEFGLHECLPLYSGGLGILSGDHLKSASDLGLPLVGVGLLYRHGYFGQYLTADGWQLESYPPNDFFNMPTQLVTDDHSRPLVISVPILGREVWARVWRVQVGRIPLYLLDSDVDLNSERDRAITSHLYGGGLETRIEQEILLGIGGIRALAALHHDPAVFHINEGHSAFLTLERVRRLVSEHNLSFPVAREVVTNSSLFTTHTPVPAGIDKFPPDMIRAYFRGYAPELGITIDDLIQLGQEHPHNPSDLFNMAVLALRLSAYANGVSKLHGEISRHMWSGLWPDIPEGEIPILHITNGIHLQSWASNDMAELYSRHLARDWQQTPEKRETWERVARIPDEELWAVHNRRKRVLVEFARGRLKEQLARSGAHPHEFLEANEVLDPEALTLGFARRFATYKRATLLFRDLERLKRIVTNTRYPIQFVFAGKAHPRDNQGKEFIRQIIQVSRYPEFRKHLVFIQDYDMLVARHLVQGVDVWLNTPRRPLEASGTSGMKSTVNGVLNLSILDGWWCEGYNTKNGWVIGEGEDYEDHEYQDTVESHALYNLLEKTILPLYYDRDASGLPRNWIAMMKESMRSICPFFNTNRMVAQYTEDFYLPCFKQTSRVRDNGFAVARELHEWKNRIEKAWKSLRVVAVEADTNGRIRIGDALPVRVKVDLGPLSPEEMEVEAYHGRLNEKGVLTGARVVALQFRGRGTDGLALYEGAIPCESTGERGFMVRLLPRHAAQPHLYYSALIKWWEN